MRVHVVGSSGTFPAHGRPATGYVIEHQDIRVWCDAGPGTFISLPIDPDLIDVVVLSHQHPDHCADIFAAFHAWTFRPEPRRGVPLYAPQPVWDRICGFIGRDPECFAFTPVSTADGFTLESLSVEFVEMDHSVPTVGSRWSGAGRTMFYTADTGPGGVWQSRAEGVDLLLCEASYQGDAADKEYTHHLTAGEAGEIARRLGARALTLTHIPPYMTPAVSVSEAEATFGRQVRFAVPGTSFDV